jgi:UPF0716 protein FxsA
MPLLIAVLLLPIVEIWLLIEIGGEIGAGATILWIVVSAVIGGVLLRSQGAQATARVRAALAQTDPDGRLDSAALAGELLDGLTVVVAGLCLILPGFLTDAVGILLFIPGLRRVIGRVLWRGLRGSPRMRVYAAGGRGPFRRDGLTVIEGEYRDVTETRGGNGDATPPRLP